MNDHRTTARLKAWADDALPDCTFWIVRRVSKDLLRALVIRDGNRADAVGKRSRRLWLRRPASSVAAKDRLCQPRAKEGRSDKPYYHRPDIAEILVIVRIGTESQREEIRKSHR